MGNRSSLEYYAIQDSLDTDELSAPADEAERKHFARLARIDYENQMIVQSNIVEEEFIDIGRREDSIDFIARRKVDELLESHQTPEDYWNRLQYSMISGPIDTTIYDRVVDLWREQIDPNYRLEPTVHYNQLELLENNPGYLEALTEELVIKAKIATE